MRVLKPASLILILLILVKFVLQYLVVHPVYDLHRDEYLHLDQAHHLAWGYASVPPVTSWISWIIFQLGNSEFLVRFFPALFGALTMLVTWKATERLGGKLFALSATATAVLLSSLLRLNMLYQPNSLEILCWTTLFYFLIVYIQTEKPKWLYFAALVFAVGFLNKYNIVFMVAGLVPALLLTPQRKIFLDKHLYGAAALSLLLVSPNLAWQWQNDFPVFRHLEELASTQLHLVKRSDFLVDQLFFFAGSLLILLAAWIALIVYAPFRPFRFLLLSLLITLSIFIYFKAKSYYAIGLYPIFLAFGSVYAEKILNNGWKKWLRILAYALPVLLFIPMLKLAFPLKEPGRLTEEAKKEGSLGMHRWEDGKEHPISQDFADMLGWKELARKTDQLFEKIPGQATTLVICDNYGQAGAINYYTHKAIQAHSLSADYFNWLVDALKKNKTDYTDVILVQEMKNDNTKELRPNFDNVIVADSITQEWARERGTRIIWLQGARISIRDYLQKIIAAYPGSKTSSG